MAYKDIANIITVPAASEIDTAEQFVVWTQATLGTPYATIKDYTLLKRRAKELFKNQPGSDWSTVVQVAQWCQGKKRRCAHVYQYVDQFRYAWQARAIELESQDTLENQIEKALRLEDDSAWSQRLRRSSGLYRQEVLDEWRAYRKEIGRPSTI